eukprot:SAG31_NODE_9137_length_1328_cov_1.371847_1_plen_98_part_00
MAAAAAAAARPFRRSQAIETWCGGGGGGAEPRAPHVVGSLCGPLVGPVWAAMLEELGLQEHARTLRPLQMLLAIHNGQLTSMDEACDDGANPSPDRL